MKSFFIHYGALNSTLELGLTEFEFREIEAAKQTLVGAFNLEEKYDCLLSNYIEFEKEAASLMIEDLVKHRTGYRDSYELRRMMNIRMLNFLSSARMYVDHVKHDVKQCMNGSEMTKKEVKRLFSAQYDSNKYYRFMEGLRNHAQHLGLPVHQTLNGSQWSTFDGKKTLRESKFEFFADIEQLTKADIVKRIVLDEFSDKVDLKLAARSYVESLSHVNERIREHIEPRIVAARDSIENAVERYSILGDERRLALFAYELDNDEIVNQVSLNSEWEKVRNTLRSENPELRHFTRRYVSTLSDGVVAHFEKLDKPDI